MIYLQICPEIVRLWLVFLGLYGGLVFESWLLMGSHSPSEVRISAILGAGLMFSILLAYRFLSRFYRGFLRLHLFCFVFVSLLGLYSSQSVAAVLLFLVNSLLATWIWIQIQNSFSKPYLSSGLKWYEGGLRNLPGITCELALGDPKNLLQGEVAQIDPSGIFIVFPKREATVTKDLSLFFKKNGPLRFRLQFQQESYWLQGRVVSLDPRVAGLGLLFSWDSDDVRRDLFEVIRVLGSYGYA